MMRQVAGARYKSEPFNTGMMPQVLRRDRESKRLALM